MLSTVINGLVIGSVYALVGFGLVVLYRGAGVLNFAHGEVGMFGAFCFFAAWTELRLPYAFAVMVGLAVSGGIGLTAHLLLRRQREHPFNVVLGTLAIAGILQFAASDIWGTDPIFIRSPFESLRLELGSTVIVGPRLAIIVAAAGLGAGLFALFRGTSFGMIFRAIAVDRPTAELMGIDVKRFEAGLWVGAAMLSGLAAILVTPVVNFQVYFMTLLVLRAFVAVVLAGLVSIGGTLVAGLAIGVGEGIVFRWSSQPGAVEAILTVVVVATLLLRLSIGDRPSRQPSAALVGR